MPIGERHLANVPGTVTGSLPPGLVSPISTSAIAPDPRRRAPRQAGPRRMPAAHSMASGRPLTTTRTTGVPVATTASTAPAGGPRSPVLPVAGLAGRGSRRSARSVHPGPRSPRPRRAPASTAAAISVVRPVLGCRSPCVADLARRPAAARIASRIVGRPASSSPGTIELAVARTPNALPRCAHLAAASRCGPGGCSRRGGRGRCRRWGR